MGKFSFCCNKRKPSTHKRTKRYSLDFIEKHILLFGNKYANSKAPDGCGKKIQCEIFDLDFKYPNFYLNINFFGRIMSSFQIMNGSFLQI